MIKSPEINPKNMAHDSIFERTEIIKNMIEKNKDMMPLLNFEKNGNDIDINDIKFLDFVQTIMSLGGTEEQLEYIKSDTNSHIFKGSIKDKKIGNLEYAVKVVAYQKKEIYGNINILYVSHSSLQYFMHQQVYLIFPLILHLHYYHFPQLHHLLYFLQLIHSLVIVSF
jgi:hypothetical protein